MVKSLVTPLSPQEALERIRKIGDPAIVDPSVPSLYRGTRPIVSAFSGERFRLMRRIRMAWVWWFLTPGSWFQPHISGKVLPRDHGSELELEGGANLAFKIGWVLTFGILSGLVAILTIFHYPAGINFTPERTPDQIRLGFLVLNLLAALTIIVPLIGWLMTRKDLPYLVSEVQKELGAEEVPLRS